MRGVAPKSSCIEFARKNETPSALISGAMRGALRNGRYAKRSITTPSTAQPAIAASVTSTSSAQIGTIGFDRAAEQLQRAEADERADHEDVAVREVQQLQDAVDERVAERDQRVDAAERQRVDGELDEGVHAGE